VKQNNLVLALRFFFAPRVLLYDAIKKAPPIRSSSDDLRQWMAGRITIGGGKSE